MTAAAAAGSKYGGNIAACCLCQLSRESVGTGGKEKMERERESLREEKQEVDGLIGRGGRLSSEWE